MSEDYDFLFAKSKLSNDIIDLSIGENHILREAVVETYGLNQLDLSKLPHIFEYAPPYGYEPLVSELEDIYPGRIVIFQSAKHALAGSFYAMKAMGKKQIHIQSPFFASIPSLIEREGLKFSHSHENCDVELLVSPNNPDGKFFSNFSMQGVPTIHDAAYYTHSYIPRDFYLKPLGDIQIFSVAKMFGLSGLRLGWIVINDCSELGKVYYKHLTKFVEATTAGVSTMSQAVLLHILSQQYINAQKIIDYENYVREYLGVNRKYCKENLNGNFEVPRGEQIGMFLWVKCEKQNFLDVGVSLMPGDPFGDANYIRINLATKLENIIKAVNKMNKSFNS